MVMKPVQSLKVRGIIACATTEMCVWCWSARVCGWPDVPMHSGGAFTWRRNSGIAEASEVTDSGLRSLMSQMCHDCGATGFTLLSPRTNAIMTFRLDRTTRDADGDVISWTLSSISDVTLTVFND